MVQQRSLDDHFNYHSVPVHFLRNKKDIVQYQCVFFTFKCTEVDDHVQLDRPVLDRPAGLVDLILGQGRPERKGNDRTDAWSRIFQQAARQGHINRVDTNCGKMIQAGFLT